MCRRRDVCNQQMERNDGGGGGFSMQTQDNYKARVSCSAYPPPPDRQCIKSAHRHSGSARVPALGLFTDTSRQQRHGSPVVRAGGGVEELGEEGVRVWLGGWEGQRLREF